MISGNGLSGRSLTISNVYKKVKIFEKIKSRKLNGNVDDPFSLKRLFFCINIPEQCLA